MTEFKKEIELIDKFCEYLSELGYIWKREFRRGSYHNEGYCDIVILDGVLISVEAKISGFSEVLKQARYNTGRFPFNYVLYPRLPNKRSMEKINETPIGLIIFERNKFRVVKKPRKTIWFSLYQYKKYALRNWRENRVGRKFDSKELPRDYPKEKLKQLGCTYDWVKVTKKNRLEKIEIDIKYKGQKTIDNFISAD